MKTSIKIITLKDIMELYGFSRKRATALLNTKGCPILPREDGQNYKVIQDEFEMWLRSRKV